MKSRIMQKKYLMVLLPFLIFCFFNFYSQGNQYDTIIVDGMVLDGSGNPWFYADIGIKDGKIVFVGDLEDNTSAGRIIDAEGKTVVPGFIDIHDHTYDAVRNEDSWTRREIDDKKFFAPNFIGQGITTVVSNQCGHGPTDIATQIQALTNHGIGPNAMLMIGHNNVRTQVMGRGSDSRRTATPEEIVKMRELIKKAMEDGASGMSAGLEYVPAIWSDTHESMELVKEIIPYGGVYIVHERSSGQDPMWYVPSQDEPGPPTMLDNVAEIIEVSETTGVKAVVTHIKVKGANYWGTSKAVIHLIDRARARGVDIWGDCYPYNTTGTDGNTVLIPGWAYMTDRTGEQPQQRRRGGNTKEALQKTLADSKLTQDLRRDIKHEINRRGSAQNIIVMDYPDQSFIGKSLAELSKQFGISHVDMAIKLQLEGYDNRRGGARLRGFSLSEIDVEAFSAQPWCATSTDANIALPEDGPDIHPRFYGSFPRKIKHYAMSRGIMTVENAVRASTSLPALIMGLKDRGMIKEGYCADIVVLDLNTIQDKATFFEPHQHSEGIDYVLVNGEFALDKGELTWKLAGKVLKNKKVK
ncbi:amidohydrolase family protein [candidate division KSB1 bacterium]